MGLAPYGRPRFIEQFRDIIRTEKKGQFRLNLDYFRHAAEGVDMTWNDGSPRIGRIFSDEYVRKFGAAREPNTQVTDRESDLAASLQLRLEEVAFHVLNYLHSETGLTDLGLSGGVAYNSVMNGKILLHTPFRRVFVQPAAGDSGTALGVGYQIYNNVTQAVSLRGDGGGDIRGFKRGYIKDDAAPTTQANSLRYSTAEADRSRYSTAQANSLLYGHCVMEGAYTGPEFTNEEIRNEIEKRELEYETF